MKVHLAEPFSIAAHNYGYVLYYVMLMIYDK